MTMQQRPDAADTRLVFRVYAALAWLAVAWVLFYLGVTAEGKSIQ